jgi:ribosomal protein L11 methyltransferase
MQDEKGWLVISTLGPPTGREFLVVDALNRLGARSVTRQAERIVAHLPPPADQAALLREAEAVLRLAAGTEPSLLWHWQSQADWAESWRGEQQTRRITDRIVVVPDGHDPDTEPAAGDVVIRLDPGPAFGTAEHGTTRGCLELLERRVTAGDVILDVGTGTGILAVAAVLLGAQRVLAFEADELSCESARHNAAINDVADRIEIDERVVSADHLRALEPVDGIAANLETRLIATLLPALPDALKPGGWLITAGVTGGERDEVLAAAEAAGFALDDEAYVDRWWSATFVRGQRSVPERRTRAPRASS